LTKVHLNGIIFNDNTILVGRELWRVVAESLKVARLGRKRFIGNDDDRTPHVDLLFGEHGWVEHVDDRGIRFVYDASKRVFNNKKTREMQRISEWDCHGETVVDMYAGKRTTYNQYSLKYSYTTYYKYTKSISYVSILGNVLGLGYYSMRFLKCCGAKQVIAIDWSDDMCEALRRTTKANDVQNHVVIIEGDCRRVTPCMVADRVFLGLVPSCRAHWLTACKALKKEGGMLHIHEVIDVSMKNIAQKESTTKKNYSDFKRTQKPTKCFFLNTHFTCLECRYGCNQWMGSRYPRILSRLWFTLFSNIGKNVSGPPVKDGDENQPVKRKLSRSQSIVEELESRILPTPTVLKDFENGGWKSLSESYRGFAIDCATTHPQRIRKTSYNSPLVMLRDLLQLRRGLLDLARRPSSADEFLNRGTVADRDRLADAVAILARASA
uniref:tRNA wybutosine-synthesizing protein 2 homolog n=1 Tax=Angiostrongylus cantonensis TaxID=6313 RepID=A0A158P697_ANGCA